MAYFRGFDDAEDMRRAFDEPPETFGTPDILFAVNDSYSCEALAFVLLRLDGRLFEVNASHCSCDGYEGQWAPEPTSADALRMRKSIFGLTDEEFQMAVELAAEATR